MSEYFATITKLRVPCPQVLYSLVEVGNYVMYKLLLPPKFPLPLLADFSVYLAPAQVLLNVCSGHVCGRDDIYLLFLWSWVLPGSMVALGSVPSSAADSLGRSLLSSCMMSSLVDDLGMA